jgi:transcriptional regulator with XRE-family HTH domain
MVIAQQNWAAFMKDWRQRAGFSGKAAAERIGIEQSSYFRIERGERKLTIDKAFTLADMFGCRVDDFRLPPEIVLAPSSEDDY